MAKNNTQKILKSLVYLALEKDMIIEIRDSKYRFLLDSKFLSKEEVFKKYKSISKGYLYLKEKNNTISTVGIYTFDIMNDKIEPSKNDESEYYLDQAKFLSSMHN